MEEKCTKCGKGVLEILNVNPFIEAKEGYAVIEAVCSVCGCIHLGTVKLNEYGDD